jgi:hypothetical protein
MNGAIPTGYQVRYFDDIKMLGTTVSTTFGKFSAFGEASYRKGTPVLNGNGVAVRGDVVQGNVGGIFNIGRTGIADDMSLAAEISGSRVISVADGSSTDNLSFKTRNSLVAGATLTLGYPGIFEGWDLSIPISYQSQLRGRSGRHLRRRPERQPVEHWRDFVARAISRSTWPTSTTWAILLPIPCVHARWPTATSCLLPPSTRSEPHQRVNTTKARLSGLLCLKEV